MTLSVRRFTFVLGALIFLFVVAHVLFVFLAISGHERVFGLAPLFNLDWEQGLPTWYSSLALAFSALLLFTMLQDQVSQP